ncbi:enoyl-CoA hydratase/isomerase family protein [Arthrobacter mobilis]|uniref:enoyl-CoA hydratase n=1 Tax=Arthrobacter mobilis TaxID=2724944 RepID=A0A7X6HEA7_9MICC|nr:enoyl-CoA hydratase-related protein [Arthrobacter mobilis]NKX55549.1 enoyl-CoA hydratase/isomerase family protein [Arthrobacter mobilis]
MTETLPGTDTVCLDLDPTGQIATITIDRQHKLNALTLELLEDLEPLLHQVDSSSARVLVLRTAGSKVFCVGADITRFSQFSPVGMWRQWITIGHRVFNLLAGLRQPTIAVVDGLAVGGGLELAMACDFRIAADTAGFGLPETSLGTIPGWGGTERLTQLVGPARAKEIILARRRIGAETALAWGLITEAVPSEDLDAATGALVAILLEGAPIAQQTSKQLIHAAAAGAPSAILEAIASGFTAATEDFREGVASFQEKRPATFTGA